jgi:hypothetical protein
MPELLATTGLLLALRNFVESRPSSLSALFAVRTMLFGRYPFLSVATSLPARPLRLAAAPTACLPSTLSALTTIAAAGAVSTTVATASATAVVRTSRPNPLDIYALLGSWRAPSRAACASLRRALF